VCNVDWGCVEVSASHGSTFIRRREDILFMYECFLGIFRAILTT
jgi:hypothetical protein